MHLGHARSVESGGLTFRPSDVAAFARSCALAAVLTALTLAERSSAQEITLTGPLEGACPLILARYRTPASLEWSYWIGTGVSGIRQMGADHVSAFVRAGADMTVGVLTYPGFPAPSPPRGFERPQYRGNVAELRLGPWAAAETRAAGALVEGGVTAHLGTVDDYVNGLVYVEPYGVFDLRLAGGYGAFPEGRSPHLGLALGWGYRFVFDRQSWGGACDPEPTPPVLADATLVRLVATVRTATDFPATEVLLAIEVTPTMALALARSSYRPRRP